MNRRSRSINNKKPGMRVMEELDPQMRYEIKASECKQEASMYKMHAELDNALFTTKSSMRDMAQRDANLNVWDSKSGKGIGEINAKHDSASSAAASGAASATGARY